MEAGEPAALTLTDMPAEIVWRIQELLDDIYDQVALRSTCTQMRQVLNRTILHRSLKEKVRWATISLKVSPSRWWHEASDYELNRVYHTDTWEQAIDWLNKRCRHLKLRSAQIAMENYFATAAHRIDWMYDYE